MAQHEPHHLAGPQRRAHGARDLGQRLALPTLGLALGEQARVRDRGAGLPSHGAQQLLVLHAVRARRFMMHRDHTDELRADAHRRRKHGGGRAGVAHHVVRLRERRARRVVMVHAHGLAGARRLGNGTGA